MHHSERGIALDSIVLLKTGSSEPLVLIFAEVSLIAGSCFAFFAMGCLWMSAELLVLLVSWVMMLVF